ERLLAYLDEDAFSAHVTCWHPLGRIPANGRAGDVVIGLGFAELAGCSDARKRGQSSYLAQALYQDDAFQKALEARGHGHVAKLEIRRCAPLARAGKGLPLGHQQRAARPVSARKMVSMMLDG